MGISFNLQISIMDSFNIGGRGSESICSCVKFGMIWFIEAIRFSKHHLYIHEFILYWERGGANKSFILLFISIFSIQIYDNIQWTFMDEQSILALLIILEISIIKLSCVQLRPAYSTFVWQWMKYSLIQPNLFSHLESNDILLSGFGYIYDIQLASIPAKIWQIFVKNSKNRILANNLVKHGPELHVDIHKNGNLVI